MGISSSRSSLASYSLFKNRSIANETFTRSGSHVQFWLQLHLSQRRKQGSSWLFGDEIDHWNESLGPRRSSFRVHSGHIVPTSTRVFALIRIKVVIPFHGLLHFSPVPLLALLLLSLLQIVQFGHLNCLLQRSQGSCCRNTSRVSQRHLRKRPQPSAFMWNVYQ